MHFMYIWFYVALQSCKIEYTWLWVHVKTKIEKNNIQFYMPHNSCKIKYMLGPICKIAPYTYVICSICIWAGPSRWNLWEQIISWAVSSTKGKLFAMMLLCQNHPASPACLALSCHQHHIDDISNVPSSTMKSLPSNQQLWFKAAILMLHSPIALDPTWVFLPKTQLIAHLNWRCTRRPSMVPLVQAMMTRHPTSGCP